MRPGPSARPQYVIINGSFGIGKTTIARRLRQSLPGAAIFDPEHLGFVLRRLPGYRRSDYQELRSWRRLTTVGARMVGTFRPTVLIPMAFSNLAVLDELRSGLAAKGSPVLHFCLTAPLRVVRERLAGRGEPLHDPRWSWVHRRAEECCRAHRSVEFAVHVPTEGSSPSEISEQLGRLIMRDPAAPGRAALGRRDR